VNDNLRSRHRRHQQPRLPRIFGALKRAQFARPRTKTDPFERFA
jgi:hypothetical protein